MMIQLSGSFQIQFLLVLMMITLLILLKGVLDGDIIFVITLYYRQCASAH